MGSCNWILKFCLLWTGERLLSPFLSCYVVRSCACRSWFLINFQWNTGPIKFKLMQKVGDLRRNYWNKVSQNIIEEFSWTLQWPVKKTTRCVVKWWHALETCVVWNKWNNCHHFTTYIVVERDTCVNDTSFNVNTASPNKSQELSRSHE